MSRDGARIPPAGLVWVDGGGLLDGAWHRGDVCATIAVGDAESGVGAVWLVSGAVSAVWIAPLTGSQYQPGIACGQPTLCLGAAALGDGIHAGAVGRPTTSAASRPTALPFTRASTRPPPGARLLSPGCRRGRRAACASCSRSAMPRAASPPCGADRRRDGAARARGSAGERAAPRGPGLWRARAAWSVVDAAGNSRGRERALQRARHDAAGIRHRRSRRTAPRSASGDVLAVAVAVSDDGSGVDPASAEMPARRRSRRRTSGRRRASCTASSAPAWPPACTISCSRSPIAPGTRRASPGT